MRYSGIDLGGASSYACVQDKRGAKVWTGWVPMTADELTRFVKRYGRSGLRVAIEAGNQTAWVHDVLVAAGASVIVVHPKRVKLIAESRSKTDKIDAKTLCNLLRLDGLPTPVHVPGVETRGLRGLLVARRKLIQSRTGLCNMVRGMLRQEGTQLPVGALSSQAGWQRVFEKGFEHEHLLHIVASFHQAFLALCQAIRELDVQLAEYERKLTAAQRLQTIPRVGRIAALTFVAAVDDVRRFSSSRKLVSYSGLAPTVRQSGSRTTHGSITREGRRELRSVWVQIAHQVARDQSRATEPLRAWYRRVAGKRGKKTALVALTRRLLVIAYQLLKTETDYDVSRLRKKRRAA